jgi:hypothetical protein
MGFNTNTKNEPEWLTPKYIIDALGPFDLAPCAPPIERRPWNTAINHFSKEVDGDGLSKDWQGRVWLNPPYGRETFKWLAKLAEHKSGVALIFARTETAGFHKEIWEKAHGVFFFKGRLSFGVSGTGELKDRCNAPSCLVSYSHTDSTAIHLALISKKLSGRLLFDLQGRM